MERLTPDQFIDTKVQEDKEDLEWLMNGVFLYTFMLYLYSDTTYNIDHLQFRWDEAIESYKS